MISPTWTWMPLFAPPTWLAILPEVTFQPGRWPWAPTVEGQYIIKNVLIIAAALTLGGRVRPPQRGQQRMT